MVKKTIVTVLAIMLACIPLSSHAATNRKAYKIKRLVSQLYDRSSAMDAQRQLSSYGTEVSEHLLSALQDRSNASVQIAALNIIASVHDSSMEDEVVTLLNDNKPRVRQIAARTLSVIGEKQSSVGPLKSLLNDYDPNVRYNAVKALARLKPKDEVDLFIAVLGDYDPRVRLFAIIALGDLKAKKAVPYLSQMVRDVDPGVRRELVIALAKIGTQDCLQPLVWLMSDPDVGVRVLAIEEISRMRLDGIDAPLVKAANNPDPRIASRAIIALGNRKSDKAMEVAKAHLNDEHMSVKLASVEVIGKIGGESERQLLESLLSAESTLLRQKAQQALDDIKYHNVKALTGQGGKNETDSFIDALGDPDPRVRMVAVIALGDLRSAEAVFALSRLVTDADPGIRLELVRTLAKIDTKDCLQPLVKLMADPDLNVRVLAVEKISKMKVDGADEQLVKAADNPDPRIVSRAIIALGERKSKKALSTARVHVNDRNMAVKLASVEVIGKMGGGSEKALLESLTQVESTRLRKKAEEALAEINSRT